MNFFSHILPPLHHLLVFHPRAPRSPVRSADPVLHDLQLLQHPLSVLQTEKEYFQAEEVLAWVLLSHQSKNPEKKVEVCSICNVPQLKKTRLDFKVFPRNHPVESGRFISYARRQRAFTRTLVIKRWENFALAFKSWLDCFDSFASRADGGQNIHNRDRNIGLHDNEIFLIGRMSHLAWPKNIAHWL